MSVNVGDTVSFKIKTTASSYHIDILRLGYYQGNGARKVAAGLRPTATLPADPARLPDGHHHRTDRLRELGGVGVWTVPSTAVSGVYIAHLVRDDTGGASQIVFVVRDDSSHSDVLFQTSDTTWQAYNTYGGNSLYTARSCPAGNPRLQGPKVSYNRPFTPTEPEQGVVYDAEYPMVRFLEANGYDVSYMSGVDVDSRGPLLLNHKVFLSVGHDEYWSGNQRAERRGGARRRRQPRVLQRQRGLLEDAVGAEHRRHRTTAERTLVTYKETHYNAPVDPKDPPIWTGTWRDPRFSPPADGGRPENALTGQYFVVNSGTTDIQVPSAQYSGLRLWRNTAVANLAAGQTLTLGAGNRDARVRVGRGRSTTASGPPGSSTCRRPRQRSGGVRTDYGSNVRRRDRDAPPDAVPGRQRRPRLRRRHRAVVVGPRRATPERPSAATATCSRRRSTSSPTWARSPTRCCRASWRRRHPPTRRAPTSTITSPVAERTRVRRRAGHGHRHRRRHRRRVVAGVEVSTDGGATWHPATGTTNWSYSWIAHGSPAAV